MEQAPRACHVAVQGSASAPEGNFPPGQRERRARGRLLRDAQVRELAQGGAPLAWLALAAVAAALMQLPARGVTLAWAVLAAAAWLAWAAMPLWLRTAALKRHGRELIVALAAAGFTLLALLPWLPDADAQRWWTMGMLGAVSMAGVCMLAPARPAASMAAILPLSPALAGGLSVAGDAGQLAASLLFGAVLSVLAALLARRRHAAWRRDAADRLDREDRLRRLAVERDEAQRAERDKTRFLANASHDLRQPVHASGLFAATLERRLRDTQEEPLVRNLMRSIDGLDRSLTAMLDISRLDAGTVEPNIQHFPLRDVFRRLHMHFAGQAELAGLALRFSPGGKFVSSDPQMLERILANLIQNALKYTERGGVAVLARSTATQINVEVWDTGVGIGAAELPRVFDEFYQVGRSPRARSQGLGMGLAIVKRLAQLLGHRLTVVSQPGRGSLFRVGIALSDLAEVQDVTVPADTRPMPVSEPRTVLVVDDEEPIREGLRGLLEEWGYVAVLAASAGEAEETTRLLHAPPDLILSDLHLGDGPDGIAAIEAVRRCCGRDVPAILVTGDTSHEEVRRASESGHHVLIKPVQARRLFNAMRAMVA